MKKALCWLLAFLLTGTLALFGVTWSVSRVVDPALREGGAAVTDQVQETEMNLIRERIEELAPLYGFSAETALACVTEEKLEEMNRQTALWWNSLLSDGEAGDAPFFDTEELAAALEAEMLSGAEGTDEESEEQLAFKAADAANDIGESVLRVVLPLRLPVIGIGLKEASARMDLGNVIRFLLGIRWLMLALSGLLAGLIALLESRKLRNSLKYYGSAMGAAVLVLAAGGTLYRLTGIQPLIREASPSLAAQYGSLLSQAVRSLGIFAALLAAGCVVCLLIFRRTHEAETD